MGRIWVVGLLALVLVAGCKVDTTVIVDVRDDGSGVVRVRVALDTEAVGEAEAGGGRLEDRVRTADLAAAGWRVSPWARRPGGGATLVLAKPFGNVEALGPVIAELNGDRGPVREVSLTRDANLLTTSFEVTGVADLTDLTSDVLDDPELVARLTAEQVDLTAVDARLTQQLRDSFRLRVVVRFPDGSREAFAVAPGSRTALDGSSSELDATRAGLLATAGVLAVVGIVILVQGERRRSRTRRRSARPGAPAA